MKSDMIQKLLDEVVKIDEQASSVTFLSLLGQKSREMTHSSFLASLLDPKGGHNQGTFFLDAFLNCSILLRIIPFDSKTAKVEVEKDMGPVETDEHGIPIKGGRADIYMEDAEGHVVVIENKIYAADQPRQLERYWNSTGKQGYIIYLTLDNRIPPKESLGEMWPSLVIPISYRDEISGWLQSCIDKISDDSLKNILVQYIITLKQLTCEYEVIKSISMTASNMKSAVAVANALDKARGKVAYDFMRQLSMMFNDSGLEKEVYKDSEGWHFTFKNGMSAIEVCIEWRLFIRVPNDQMPKDAKLDKDWHIGDETSWRYIDIDGENFDFHNFSDIALKYIDNPEKTVRQAYLRIIDVLK